MPTRFKSILPISMMFVFCLGIAFQSGCDLSFEHDPATTVKIEISNISSESDRENVQEKLGEMTDGNGHFMTTTSDSTSDSNSLTVNLSPVSDVKAFSEKIDFGEVTGVEGRTVKVKFNN